MEPDVIFFGRVSQIARQQKRVWWLLGIFYNFGDKVVFRDFWFTLCHSLSFLFFGHYLYIFNANARNVS